MELIDRVAQRLKLRDLRLLETVVKSGSMAKAADRLNISQPAVSKAIAELEHLLGVPLLERNRRGINPTEHGRALLDCGVAVLDELRQGISTIEFLSDPSAGAVRIGSTAFLAASFLPAVVERLARRNPRMVFHLLTGSNAELHRALDERKVDVLVTRRLGSIADMSLEFEPVFDDSFVVAAGAGHRCARRRHIRLADLLSERWVLPPPGSAISLVAEDAFRKAGLDFRGPTVFAVAPETRIGFLGCGQFLTILPASVLRFPPRRPEIKILPVELSVPPAPVGFVTLKDRSLNPVARLFKEEAREVAKQLRKRGS